MAAREVVSCFTHEFGDKFSALEAKLERVLAVSANREKTGEELRTRLMVDERLSRLEAFFLSRPDPSVDEVPEKLGGCEYKDTDDDLEDGRDSDPWHNGHDPWAKWSSNCGRAKHRDQDSLAERPRTHEVKPIGRNEPFASDEIMHKLEHVEQQVQLLLAGMALAIGPGFNELMKVNEAGTSACEPQPEKEMSPEIESRPRLRCGELLARCLTFDMTQDDETCSTPVAETAANVGLPTLAMEVASDGRAVQTTSVADVAFSGYAQDETLCAEVEPVVHRSQQVANLWVDLACKKLKDERRTHAQLERMSMKLEEITTERISNLSSMNVFMRDGMAGMAHSSLES